MSHKAIGKNFQQVRGREVENEVRDVVSSQMKNERILDFGSNFLENNLETG